MGVAERHLNCMVPEQFLHSAQTHPGHDKSAGEGVAQAVPPEVSDGRLGHARVCCSGLQPTRRSRRARSASVNCVRNHYRSCEYRCMQHHSHPVQLVAADSVMAGCRP